MKKKSKTFLIILSLFVCLFTACGIPNYFGNISKYVTLYGNGKNGHKFKITDHTYSDGFSPRDVEPKLMFLYTIYSFDKAKDTLSTVQTQLKNEFLKEYKLSDYDFKGCTATWNGPVVKTEIKDVDNKDIVRTYGLYQLKTTGDKLNPGNTELPTNYSSDYLFNADNMNFEYNKDYIFKYTTESIDDSTDLRLVITCSDIDGNVIASYYMGNYEGNDFHTKLSDQTSQDYGYAGLKTNLYILPVLYLESSKYSNRQMMIGEWKEVSLQLPEKPSTQNTLPSPVP